MTERKLLRLEVRNAETPIERKPAWIKTRLRTGPEYTEIRALVDREGLHTVCQEAGCPNIYECWEDREATFLIGGEQCTRRCDFCQIDTGKPAPLDPDEPRRVAESVRTMGLHPGHLLPGQFLPESPRRQPGAPRSVRAAAAAGPSAPAGPCGHSPIRGAVESGARVAIAQAGPGHQPCSQASSQPRRSLPG